MNRACIRHSEAHYSKMRQLVVLAMARLLIISLITLNFSWVVDSCSLTGCADQVGAYSVSGDYSMPSNPATPGLDCDNWCNGCVSHIALANVTPLSKTPPVFNYNDTVSYFYFSQTAPPPVHPPKA